MSRRALACMACLAMPLGAQDVPPPRPSLPDLPASVRSAGLAGLAVALPGDAAVVFDNPSAIGPLRRLAVEGSYARLPDRSWYTTGAAALRVGPVRAGGGYRYLDRAPRDPVAGNLQWVGAVASRVGPVHVGVAANYVSVEDSAGEKFRTLTEDVSAMLAFFDIAAVALVFENVGRSGLSGARLDLPPSTRLGFSLNLIDTYSNGRLLAALETIWTRDQSRRTVVGIEGGAVIRGVGVVVRIGHGAQSRGSGAGKTSYGGSLVLGRARIDYAHQPESPLGAGVHLFGLHWTQ
jgi:hypothetical protein